MKAFFATTGPLSASVLFALGAVISLFVHITPGGLFGLENLTRVSVNISGESKNG